MVQVLPVYEVSRTVLEIVTQLIYLVIYVVEVCIDTSKANSEVIVWVGTMDDVDDLQVVVVIIRTSVS